MQNAFKGLFFISVTNLLKNIRKDALHSSNGKTMSDKERFEKQMEFIREVDKSKEIFRQSYVTSGSRHENDAEHAWHLAMMAMIMNEYANEKVDLLRVIEMVLVHDLVEIDAGDTYAYDNKGNETKRERELAAADRIFNILPNNQAKMIRGLWDEFEAGETKEAKFAITLDKTQPIMLNDATDGRAWMEHGVNKEQIMARNKKTPDGSVKIWEYFENIINKNVEKGRIKE